MWFDALATSSRRLASNVRRYVFPRPEEAAWRRACEQARRVPRFTKGSIRMLDYELEFVDLLTLCPQWNDLFVRETLRVHLDGGSPRVLDCGANIGLATLYFKRLYPGARVTAYEADPDICAVLSRNLRRNGCADVEVVNAAVWTGDGPVAFRCDGADSGAVDSVAGISSGRTATVPGVRLRSVLAEGEVSLLKLDIEGGEEDVLRDSFDALRNVRVLLLDLHEFDPAKRRTPAVFELLADAGFVYSLDDLVPLPWREPRAAAKAPFPGTHLCWASLVRAWRA
jgi:FkbM family methyltransferase